MTAEEESSAVTSTPDPPSVPAKQHVTRWRTAEKRAAGLSAKKQRRRAAHRVALRRSHANG
jgi:hypothetical protein